MMKIDQTITVDDPTRQGNCLSACVASLLHLRLDQVPHFAEYEPDTPNAWWALLVGFMAGRGLAPTELDDPGDAEPGEVVFVAGPSPRGPFWHQVLYRDGVLWHDPHPSRDGLVAVTEVLAWRPVRFDHEPTAQPRDDVCPWHPDSIETRDRHAAGGAA